MQIDQIMFTGLGAPKPSPEGIEAAKAVANGGKARRISWSDGLYVVALELNNWKVQDERGPLCYKFDWGELNAADWIVLN
jgi:hypothetical protein